MPNSAPKRRGVLPRSFQCYSVMLHSVEIRTVCQGMWNYNALGPEDSL